MTISRATRREWRRLSIAQALVAIAISIEDREWVLLAFSALVVVFAVVDVVLDRREARKGPR